MAVPNNQLVAILADEVQVSVICGTLGQHSLLLRQCPKVYGQGLRDQFRNLFFSLVIRLRVQEALRQLRHNHHRARQDYCLVREQEAIKLPSRVWVHQARQEQDQEID